MLIEADLAIRPNPRATDDVTPQEMANQTYTPSQSRLQFPHSARIERQLAKILHGSGENRFTLRSFGGFALFLESFNIVLHARPCPACMQTEGQSGHGTQAAPLHFRFSACESTRRSPFSFTASLPGRHLFVKAGCIFKAVSLRYFYPRPSC